MKKYILILFISLLAGCEKNEQINLQTITPISSVEPYQDVRWKDLSKIAEQLDSIIIPTLSYNEKTIWPASYQEYADNILEMAKNPGLGISTIHALGITGKNVNVGIIDQNLCADYHPEYKNQIIDYFDTGCNAKYGSTHGSAVVSLLAGETIGVAPDAKVYYAAAPTWTADAKYMADGLNWIIEKNSALPADEKIRVVSVSAGPSGEGSLFIKNRELWDQAFKRAVDSNILVLDCTPHHRFNSTCYYDIFDQNDITKCQPGWPDTNAIDPVYYENLICAPSSFRTVAEQLENGNYSFHYSGKAGVSWAVPYVAGVLALGWQINPNLSNEQIKKILLETAYIYKEDFRIINPVAFVEKINIEYKN